MLINIQPYNYENRFVKKIEEYLQKYLKDSLLGAYIHGSIGTNEENKYSDFDGLVIIKDKICNSPEEFKHVSKRLQKSLKIIYKFDPLQHHGWFILKESDLQNYPQTYFPHELFKYSRSLFKKSGLELEISLKPPYDYLTPFEKLAASIQNKIDHKKPKNIYKLKGLLSQFMLLPSLYCQARDKKGIFKKYSFAEAMKDFSAGDWQIMNRVSEIRKDWDYQMNPIQKWILIRTNKYIRRIIVPLASPAIPSEIEMKLTEEFYTKMKDLINAMKKRLNAPI